jgi:hypothetical protein
MKKSLVSTIVLLIVAVSLLSTAISAESIGNNLAIESAGIQDPSVDVEKYVWDPKIQEYIDADTDNTALDITIYSTVFFKIVIHNDGDVPLFDITVRDRMNDSLEFKAADPDPDEFQHNPPFYNLEWYFPGPLPEGDMIEILLQARVNGPVCSYESNYIRADANPENVVDGDYAYVHAIEKSRDINTPFLNWLQNHPNMFPILQLLIQRLGLQ